METIICDKEAVKKMENCELFILCLKTSGYPALYPGHKNHHIIQIRCTHIASGAIFKRCIDSGLKYICALSRIHHNITMQKIQMEDAKETRIVLKQWYQWFRSKCSKNTEGRKKPALFVSHEAERDRALLLKELPLLCGKEGERLSWLFLDSKKCTMALHQNIRFNIHETAYQAPRYKGEPYKLESIALHFFNARGDFKDIDYEITWLLKLFMEQLLPLIWFSLTATEEWETKTVGVCLPRARLKKEPSLGILTHLTHLKSIKPRVNDIVNALNLEFKNEQFYQYVTSDNMITAAHVLIYGWIKTSKMEKQKEPLAPYKDVWWHIIMHVELLFRSVLGIYSDSTLSDLFGCITNRTPTEFLLNTVIEGTDIPLFPTLPGHPISYLPFSVSPELANRIYTKLNLKTSHDIKISFDMRDDHISRKSWLNNFTAVLDVESHDAFNEQTLEEAILKI